MFPIVIFGYCRFGFPGGDSGFLGNSLAIDLSLSRVAGSKVIPFDLLGFVEVSYASFGEESCDLSFVGISSVTSSLFGVVGVGISVGSWGLSSSFGCGLGVAHSHVPRTCCAAAQAVDIASAHKCSSFQLALWKIVSGVLARRSASALIFL